MGTVKRSVERKFWKWMCKLFQPLIDRIKQGIIPSTSDPELRRAMQSPQADEAIAKKITEITREIRTDSARSWREAAAKAHSTLPAEAVRKELQGPIGARIAQIVSENAAYIKTLPDEWARYASQYAYREGLKGKRPEEIEAELRKVMPGHITKNLKCIARTECAKANAAITQTRAENVGIRAYFWRCVNDERSRESHRGMDGVLVFFVDPPDPEALTGTGNSYGKYHAGNTFNCRCYMEPVVDDAFLPDTCQVHDHGTIKTMTRAQIRKQFGSKTVTAYSEGEFSLLEKEVLPKLHGIDKLFVAITLYTGMRQGEICALRWEDIDFEYSQIYITKSIAWPGQNKGTIKTPKTKNGIRSVVILPQLVVILEADRRSEGYVIHGAQSTKDEPITRQGMKRLYERVESVMQSCGIDFQFSNRRGRHTIATFMNNANVDDKTIESQLGHYSADFTRRQYMNADKDQIERSMKRLSEYMSNL